MATCTCPRGLFSTTMMMVQQRSAHVGPLQPLLQLVAVCDYLLDGQIGAACIMHRKPALVPGAPLCVLSAAQAVMYYVSVMRCFTSIDAHMVPSERKYCQNDDDSTPAATVTKRKGIGQ